MLILDRAAVERLLDLDELIDAMGVALGDLSAGRATVPPRTAAVVPGLPSFSGLLDMPCYASGSRALATKVVSVFPDNVGTALPVRQAVILVFDPQNGTPLSLMDGTYITAVRTAGCSALSARHLAVKGADTLAIVGTGAQAEAHVRLVSRVRSFSEVRIAGRDASKAEALAARLSSELGIDVGATSSIESAVRGADVVCATTFAVEPVVRYEWLSPWAHVTSVGYNPAGRELDDRLMAAAAVFVESRSHALAAVPPNRDLTDPIEDGLVDSGDVHELGEVLSGSVPGRTSPDQITLYKGVGVAIEDAVTASIVLDAARRRGDGVTIEF